jgi:hypothetical protein
MLKNSGKNWSSTEEQELVNHMNVYNGNIEIIAEIHGRSVIAINMRIELLIRRMIEIDKESKTVVAQKFRKSIEEINDILKQPRQGQGQGQGNIKGDGISLILERLDRMEKLLEKISIRQNKLLKK